MSGEEKPEEINGKAKKTKNSGSDSGDKKVEVKASGDSDSEAKTDKPVEVKPEKDSGSNPKSNGESEKAGNTKENPLDQTAILNGLFGFKLGMAFVYSDKGVQIPVTVLKVKPWTVTQIKTRQKDHYDAVQISLLERAEKNVNSAERGHLKKTLSKKGALFTREIRGQIPDGIQVGQKVNVTSFEKGFKIKITAKSKGRGFSGTMKRFNFGGGPAAHGSTFHRQPGSVGNKTWPGRIIPGKKLPGHFGNETVTVKNVEVVNVQKEEGLVFVKGPVPGPPKGLVRMLKQ